MSDADSAAVESLRPVDLPPRASLRRPLQYRGELPLVTITAVGDLMMSSWIIDLVDSSDADFPFDSTRHLVQQSDIAIANLEAPFAEFGARFEDKRFTFKVPPHFVSGVKNAGFDVVTLANNHMIDFGCDGLQETLVTLDSAGIAYSGAGNNVLDACAPVYVDVRGYRLAFVGFSMTYPQEFWATRNRCGTCYPTKERLYNIISECERNADMTIASFHWGREKANFPREYQKVYARNAIDYGADLVLGHHPHVLQGVEVYDGKLIAYSLGNYVFASYSETAKTSAVLQATIGPDGLVFGRMIPINVHNRIINFQPTVFKGAEKSAVINELNRFSLDMNQGIAPLDSNGYIFPGKILQQKLALTR